MERNDEEKITQEKKTVVKITEQTLHELLRAVTKAHAEITFTDEPWPEGDMPEEAFEKLRQRKGYILVKSPFTNIEFLISLETKPHTQESLGYNVEIIKEKE